MKKYLMSGIPAFSNGGVANLMRYLEKVAKINGYEVVYPSHNAKSIKKNILNPLFVITELFNRYVSKKSYANKINQIRDSEVILIHPQTIKYKYFFRLIENNLKVKIYVMDNSFFCIKSYNILNGEECVKCLGSFDEIDCACKPFPVRYTKKENLLYLIKYKDVSKKVFFYAQNVMQKKLLQEHFGGNINIEIIGLKTDELIDYGNEHPECAKKYDIVYHGANHEAKGVDYTLILAKLLPQYTFFIPSKLSYSDLPTNLTHRDLTWNNGLREIVQNAKLVLNPSLWSAPVEGALLKSIYYNGNVGVVETRYGFCNDIPDDAVLKLSKDVLIAKEQILTFLNSKKDFKHDSKKWLNDFLQNECRINTLFT